MCNDLIEYGIETNSRLRDMFTSIDKVGEDVYMTDKGLIKILRGKMFFTFVINNMVITFYDQPTSLNLLDFAKIVVNKCCNKEEVQIEGSILLLNGGPVTLLYDLEDNDINLFYELLDDFSPKYAEFTKMYR